MTASDIVGLVVTIGLVWLIWEWACFWTSHPANEQGEVIRPPLSLVDLYLYEYPDDAWWNL